MKRFVCFLMSFVMLFTILPANIVWAEEGESEEENSISAELGDNTVAVAAGETVLLKFVAPSDGRYDFGTAGNEDTYGYLYDSEKNEIASDDDSGNERNFHLSYEMQFGEVYYIGVKYYDSSVTGEINLIVEENLIASIEVAPVEILEGTEGYLTYDTDDEGERHYYWYYNTQNLISQQITINYKDGHSIIGTRDEIYNQTGYYADCRLDVSQNWEHPLEIGTYEAVVSFLGVSTTYNVTIIDDGIDSIEVAPVEILEGTEGYLTYDTDDEGERHYYWYYDTQNLILQQITINYKDGHSIVGSKDEIYNQTGYYVNYSFDIEQSWEHPLGVGTYEAVATFMGVKTTYNVTIIDNGISSIEVAPVEIMEGTGGYLKYDTDSARESHYYWYYYEHYLVPGQITINYKDGHSIVGNREEIYNQTGYWVDYRFDIEQSWAHPLEVGTYEATASFMGVMTTYNVTIIDNGIASIKVAPVEVAEGTGGSWVYDTDNEGINHYYWSYYPYNWNQQVTINYKDGHSITGTRNQIYKQTGHDIDYRFDVSQSWEHPLEVGTYEVVAGFMGIMTTYTVSIVDTPVASIVIDPVVIYEGGVVLEDFWDQYYAKVIYKDGHEENINLMYLRIPINSRSNAQMIAEWSRGDYECDVIYMGCEDTFIIRIEETPVERVEREPAQNVFPMMGLNSWYSISVYFKDGTSLLSKNWKELESMTGYSAGGGSFMGVPYTYTSDVQNYWIPNVERVEMDPWKIKCLSLSELERSFAELTGTVYFEDGTVFQGKICDLLNSYLRPTYYMWAQDPFRYDAATGNVTVDVLGKSVSCPVIIDCEIEHIELDDITVIKGTEFEPLLHGTIYKTDGSTYTGYISDYNNDITIGHRQLSGELFDSIGDYSQSLSWYIDGGELGIPNSNVTVHVIENPVSYIEYDNIYTSGTTWKAPNAVVHYVDGTEQNVTIKNFHSVIYDDVKYEIYTEQDSYEKIFSPGRVIHCSFSLMGQEYYYDVIQVESEYKSVAISGDDEIWLHFTTANGDTVSMKVLDYYCDRWTGSHGTLVTEGGSFEVVINKSDNSFAIELVFIDLGLRCGSIKNNTWIREHMLTKDIYVSTMDELWRHRMLLNNWEYSGNVTEDNLDYLVATALLCHYQAYYLHGSMGMFDMLATQEQTKEYLYEIFGIENADLSHCVWLHPLTGMINVLIDAGVAGKSVGYLEENLVEYGRLLIQKDGRECGYITSMWLDDDNIIRGFMNDKYTIDPQILRLADGNEWYLINGYVQHQFTGTVTIDGVEYEIVEGKVVKNDCPEGGCIVQGCSLTLAGNIGLNFYLNLDVALVVNGGYAVFEQNGIVSEPVLLSEVVHAGKQYKLTYQVSAKEMDDTIILRVYNGGGNLIALYTDEDTYVNGYPYSVNTYVELALSKDSVSDELKDLMRSMRQYGDCAQGYFGISDYMGSGVTVDSAAFEAYTFSSISNSSKVSYYGSSLLLKGMTTIRHYFTFTDGMENYSVTVNGTDVSLVQKESLCYVEIADIAAQDLEEMPVVVATDQNGQEVYRLVYGAFSYADVVMNQSHNDQLKTLMAALYLYWQSAEAYFAK